MWALPERPRCSKTRWRTVSAHGRGAAVYLRRDGRARGMVLRRMSVDEPVLAAAMAMTLRMAGGCRHSPNMRRACALATMDFLSSTSAWVLCGTKRGGLSSVLRSDLLLRGLFPPVPRLGRFGVELGDLCPSALSVRPQTRLNFGHEWLESGPKTNNGPFAPACWAAVLFVYL